MDECTRVLEAHALSTCLPLSVNKRMRSGSVVYAIRSGLRKRMRLP